MSVCQLFYMNCKKMKLDSEQYFMLEPSVSVSVLPFTNPSGGLYFFGFFCHYIHRWAYGVIGVLGEELCHLEG